MLSILFAVLALIFVFIAGAFDGAQTARKDLGKDSPLWNWMSTDKLRDWYLGGNSKYNPSFPSLPFLNFYQADFWHTMKFGIIYSWAIAVGCAAYAGLPLWGAIILGILAQGVEGQSFRIFYGNVFRNEPKETIAKILSDINPFINTHKND